VNKIRAYELRRRSYTVEVNERSASRPISALASASDSARARRPHDAVAEHNPRKLVGIEAGLSITSNAPEIPHRTRCGGLKTKKKSWSQVVVGLMPSLVLFDGVCNLCNDVVQFVIARDSRGRFQFARCSRRQPGA
jgi:hypothetical protein